MSIRSYRERFRNEVLKISQENEMLTNFIMTNFVFNQSNYEFKAKSYLEALADGYENILSTDFRNKNLHFSNKVSIIGSTKAGYVEDRDQQIFKDLFPNLSIGEDILMLDSNHWVHYEKFLETKDHLSRLYK